jgi:hypothetical protein
MSFVSNRSLDSWRKRAGKTLLGFSRLDVIFRWRFVIEMLNMAQGRSSLWFREILDNAINEPFEVSV